MFLLSANFEIFTLTTLGLTRCLLGCWKSKYDLKLDLMELINNQPSHASEVKSLMKKENQRFEAIFKYYEMPIMQQFDMAA